MHKTLFILAAVLAAMTAEAAPRRPRPHFIPYAPTNSEVVCGVKMPPRYTQAEWLQREKIIAEFRARLDVYDSLVRNGWEESLTKRQKEALKELSRIQEVKFAEISAKAAQRNAELVAITNRAAYISKKFTTRRRDEIEYHPGLSWMGEPVFKETVTRAESGKVTIHILYTRSKDGKERKHRYDPYSIERKLKEAVR